MKIKSVFVGFLSSILLLNSGLLKAQETFNFCINDTLSDRTVNDAIELSTGGYILLCDEVYTGNPKEAQLVRVSVSGQLLEAKKVELPNKSTGFTKIVQMDQNIFVLAGFQESNDSSYLWLYKMDSLFNAFQSEILSLGSYSLFTVTDLITHDEKIICSGTCKTASSRTAFIYKISQSFDSIQVRIFSEVGTSCPPDVLVKKNYKGYYFFLGGFGVAANIDILELDSSFLILSIVGVPKSLSQNPEVKWINEKYYILAANKSFSSTYRCIGAICIDTLTQLLHENYIGVPDTMEWPGLLSRLDFIDTNKIYVGGTHNFCMYSEFCPVHCWFSLTQMDTTLSVNWQYFYGGDANYTMYGIRATKDKGCLMFGSRYDLNASSLERDIYVIKVNEDGLVFPTGIESPRMYNAIVYPNPGSDHLIIESGEQISGALFRMFSMEGKEVMSQTLRDRKIRIDTKFITPGTYIWEISDKGKRIESGKWVKK